MKIVHEIFSKAQTGGSMDPYANTVDKKHLPSKGGYADLLCAFLEDGVQPEEAIHITGDAAYIYDALESMLKVLEICAEDLVKRGELVPDWKDKAKIRKETPISPPSKVVPCGTYGCTKPKLETYVFCSDCYKEYKEDPDAFK